MEGSGGHDVDVLKVVVNWKHYVDTRQHSNCLGRM